MNGTDPAVCCEGVSGKVQLNIRPLWMQRVIGADEGHSVDAVVGVLSSAVDEIVPPSLADETFATATQAYLSTAAGQSFAIRPLSIACPIADWSVDGSTDWKVGIFSCSDLC